MEYVRPHRDDDLVGRLPRGIRRARGDSGRTSHPEHLFYVLDKRGSRFRKAWQVNCGSAAKVSLADI